MRCGWVGLQLGDVGGRSRIGSHCQFASRRLRRDQPRDVRVRVDHDPLAGQVDRAQARRDQPYGRCCPAVKRPEEQHRQKYNEGTPLQGERFSMKRSIYGRDRGLTLRMFITSTMLGLLYVTFAVVLFSVLNVGLVPMLVIVVGLAFFQYYTSDKLALPAAGAKVIQSEDAPELFDTVERLAAMAELPMLRVAIVDTDVPNAFATGRGPKHPGVAGATGLMG